MPPPRGSPAAGCCVAGGPARGSRARRRRRPSGWTRAGRSPPAAGSASSTTRSISSGAKTMTRSRVARLAARLPTPLTRIRLRPPVPVAPERTTPTSMTSLPRLPSTRATSVAQRISSPSDVVRCERPHAISAMASEEAGLARGIRSPDQLRPRPGTRPRASDSPESRRGAGDRAERAPISFTTWFDRHDDVDVAVVADRLEHAGRQRPVELERELLGVDVGQDVGQVAGVERDRRPVALDGRLDGLDVVADLGIRADGDARIAVAADLELDDVRRPVGDQRGRPHRPEELLAIEDRRVLWLCGSTCW